MTTSNPIIIEETNLSHAWGKAFLTAYDRSLNNPPPLVITLTGFSDGLPAEDQEVRDALAADLEARGENSIDVSAMIVFPYRFWLRRGQPSYQVFCDWCLNKLFPRLKARDQRNRRGLYFERMMRICDYDENGDLTEHNQLAYIIEWWRERVASTGQRPRQSGLQVSCLDPKLDHDRSPCPGFPCLQQLNFTYGADGLAVTALYPTQYLFERAYGNYLGLCHLGAFMAHELGTELVRFNCVVSNAELGKPNKSDLKPLADHVRDRVPTQEEQ